MYIKASVIYQSLSNVNKGGLHPAGIFGRHEGRNTQCEIALPLITVQVCNVQVESRHHWVNFVATIRSPDGRGKRLGRLLS